jgi:hypothetical protein
MAIAALWSFWQLLDQCHPMVVNFHGTNNSATWGFYVPGNDSPIARAERHGNTFLISTHEVRKLLSTARRSALALSATTSNKAMFWHRALGCLSWQSLRRLRNADRSSQVKFTDAEFNAARAVPCNGCLKGRMTKPKVFRQSRSDSDKPTRPFQHVQADIMVNRSTTSREGFKYVLVLVCVCTRVVYGYGMKRKSDALSCFKRFRDDICAFTINVLCLPAGLGFGNDIELVRTDVDGVFTDIGFTDYARTSGIRLDTTSPNQSSPYIVDRVIRCLREMTRAYLFTSNLSTIWWYAATKCAIYVINRLPRPPRKSPIENFSGKPWDLSKLQPFGCMCHYHIPKLLRGASAALKPTSTAGIFVGYSLTSHKYAVFVFDTGAVVERSRVYFSPDVFPDDLGGVVSHSNRSTRNTTPGPTFSTTTTTADGDDPTDDETTEPTPVTTIPEDNTPSHDSKMDAPDNSCDQETGDGSDSETESDDNSPPHDEARVPRRVPVFPKCPTRKDNVDFTLGDGFIIEKERRVQNADLDTENVITGKRTRRKPVRFEAKPASDSPMNNMIRGAQMAAGAITLCMCMHCLYIRDEGAAMAMGALLADSIVLPKNYEDAMAGLFANSGQRHAK